MSNQELTDKEEAFCQEYIIDFNGTQAAIRANYSERSARQLAARLLSKDNIQQRLARLISERNERVQIDADYVLEQAVKLHKRCMQEVRPKTIRGNQVYDEDNNAVYEFDSMGAKGALELIGKHVNVQAFVEKSKMEIQRDHVSESPLNNLDSETLREILAVIERKQNE